MEGVSAAVLVLGLPSVRHIDAHKTRVAVLKLLPYCLHPYYSMLRQARALVITERICVVIDDVAGRRRAPRRDAQLRRETILSAAASCFREHGYSVHLEVNARRAGVGRATMQRNFADRETLALAVLTQEAELLKDSLDLSRPFYDSLREAVIRAMPTLAMYQYIAEELSRSETGRMALARLGEQLNAFLAPLVAIAKDRGEIGKAVSAHDIAICMQMAASVLHVGMTGEEIAINLDDAIRLLTLGFKPR